MAIGSYTAQWGPLRLYIEDVDTEIGRDQVVHLPARGDGVVIQDRGLRHSVVRCTIVFADIPDDKSWRERYAQFHALVASGEEHVFAHPLHGSFLATIGGVSETYSADADMVRVSAEFLPSEPFEAVTSIGAGVIPIAGPEAVAIAATEASEALAAAGFTADDPITALPTDTSALAESWEAAADLDPRRVVLEANSKVAEIDAAINAAELYGLEYWDAYRGLMILRDRLVSTAEAFTSDVRDTFECRIDAPIPGLTLCARLYGALLAATRREQVQRLNPTIDITMLYPGMVLTMPAEGT